MPSLGKFWNKFAKPKNIPRLFALVLGLLLIAGFLIPTALNPDQLYPRPTPQTAPGITKAQYPENSASLGWINSYMSPVADAIQSISPYFGTSIYSSPGGLIDEILYYTRGFDTILESSILMMAFIIASWLAINFTMDRKNDEEEIRKDVKLAISQSSNVENAVEESNRKARKRQARRER